MNGGASGLDVRVGRHRDVRDVGRCVVGIQRAAVACLVAHQSGSDELQLAGGVQEDGPATVGGLVCGKGRIADFQRRGGVDGTPVVCRRVGDEDAALDRCGAPRLDRAALGVTGVADERAVLECEARAAPHQDRAPVVGGVAIAQGQGRERHRGPVSPNLEQAIAAGTVDDSLHRTGAVDGTALGEIQVPRGGSILVGSRHGQDEDAGRNDDAVGARCEVGGGHRFPQRAVRIAGAVGAVCRGRHDKRGGRCRPRQERDRDDESACPHDGLPISRF